MAEAGDQADYNKLQVTEFISVSELASLMDVSFAEVISKCMSLGIMVSINQRLDAEVIELVASEFGFDVGGKLSCPMDAILKSRAKIEK